jgi:hypothetical protein
MQIGEIAAKACGDEMFFTHYFAKRKELKVTLVSEGIVIF